MNPTEAIYHLIRRFIAISEKEMEEITPFLQVRYFSKKALVVNLGEVDRYFNFVVEGLVRKYFVHNNKEINLYFAREGEILNSTKSFIQQVPSDMILETLEPTTLISIRHDDLETIYAKHPFFERIGRLVLSDQLIMKDEWEVSLLKETVRERFINFVKGHPDLLQRVPQKMLASYLNIEPETFSRLKHLLMKQPGEDNG